MHLWERPTPFAGAIPFRAFVVLHTDCTAVHGYLSVKNFITGFGQTVNPIIYFRFLVGRPSRTLSSGIVLYANIQLLVGNAAGGDRCAFFRLPLMLLLLMLLRVPWG